MAGDNHSIYMVAVPKNQALNMLLGGTVGFDTGNAEVQNGQIVLTAGAGDTDSSITFSGGNFTSSVNASATGNIVANGGGSRLNFGADAVLDALGFVSVAANENGNVTASNLTLTAGGNVFLSTGAGSSIIVDGTLLAVAGGTASLSDDDTGGSIRATDIAIAGSQIVSGARISATNSATFTTDGLANFLGTVSAPTIAVTSGDINIASGGSLGVSGVTDLLVLNAVSNGMPILIGDTSRFTAPAEGQYNLGNEDGDIHAAAVVINAIGTGDGPAPNVQILDATINNGGDESGGVSSVTLNTGGSVLVEGNIEFRDLGAGNSLTINAGENIEVNTDTGSIAMLGTGDQLAGTLNLNAANVWIAQQSILTQLEANPDYSGRDAALAVNSGASNLDGFVGADAVAIAVSSSLFGQNSGTAGDMAGITVGSGGFSIASTGETPAMRQCLRTPARRRNHRDWKRLRQCDRAFGILRHRFDDQRL